MTHTALPRSTTTVTGREIEVLLDKGLDWARPVKGEEAGLVEGAWVTTAETFALVARDGPHP